MQGFVIMAVVAQDILDICYEGKYSQHCGTAIHINSKLGFLNVYIGERRCHKPFMASVWGCGLYGSTTWYRPI
jgi:hypothetical protein